MAHTHLPESLRHAVIEEVAHLRAYCDDARAAGGQALVAYTQRHDHLRSTVLAMTGERWPERASAHWRDYLSHYATAAGSTHRSRVGLADISDARVNIGAHVSIGAGRRRSRRLHVTA